MRKIIFLFLTFITCMCFSQSIYNSQQIGQTGRNQNVSRGFWVKSDTLLSNAAVWIPANGGVGKVFTSDANGFGTWQNISGWSLTGNSGTNPSTNFIGTTDGQPLLIKTDSALYINSIDLTYIKTEGVMRFESQERTEIVSPEEIKVKTSGFNVNDTANNLGFEVNFEDTVITAEMPIMNLQTDYFLLSDDISLANFSYGIVCGNLDDVGFGDSSILIKAQNELILNGENQLTINSENIDITGTNAYVHILADTAEIQAQLVYDDGTQGAGKSLVCDANGNAYWGNQILTDTATLDFGVVTQHISSDLTISVTGAANGDVVVLGADSNSVEPNLTYFAFVSAPNTVTVRALFTGGGTVNPDAGLFKVKVLKD